MKKPAPDSTRALLFDNLLSGYAAFRRRHKLVVMPMAPSSDQMMRVVGSETVELGVRRKAWVCP